MSPGAAPSAAPGFLDDVLEFRDFGSSTVTKTRDAILYLENEFWTSGQRQAHPLHEISYRGCFKAQLPGFFIDRLSVPGEAVLDPFMGRGTTPLQAALTGRRPVGNDVNPLGAMLLAPRLRPPDPERVRRRLADAPWGRGRVEREDLLAFYHPDVLAELCAMRTWFSSADRAGVLDEVDGWIRMVTINRLTGHSPGFLSGYTLPPNKAVSVSRQERINASLGQTPPKRDVAALLARKTASLLKAGPPPAHPGAMLGIGPADRMPWLPNASVSLAVTSPPFLDTIDYAGDNWLRCWFADVDPAEVAISLHRGQAAWSDMVRGALRELARVVRPGGHVAFEVGEIRNGSLLLERPVWDAAAGLPFERLAVLVNRQNFTKTASIWGVSNNDRGTNTNRIVLLRRI